jgi:tryptophan synthase beta subunit
LESAHAIAHIVKTAKNMSKKDIIIINLSGRGDKDVDYVGELLGID